jgi:hypothetical protein
MRRQPEATMLPRERAPSGARGKNGKMVKKLLIGAVLLVGALVAISSTSKPQATVTPAGSGAPITTTAPQAKVGDKVAVGNWEYTVTKTDIQKSVTWSQFGNKSDAKGTFFIVYLTLTNRGNQNFGIGTQDFALTDAGGVTYSADTAGLSYADFLKLSKLGFGDQYPPGVAVNTLAMFDINPAATGLHLVLKQASGATIDLGK